MKTATITWIKWNNYGSMFQAYALQQYLLSEGVENKILNDECINEIKDVFHKKIVIFAKRKIKAVLNKIGFFKRKHNFLISKETSDKLFDDFKVKYLDTDSDIDKLEIVADRYDMFICGSDQIWFPGDDKIYNTICNAPFYYAGFTDKLKISYSASFGLKKYPEKFKQQFRDLVKDFQCFSVREPEGIEIIKDVTGRDACLTVDPTLLLDGIQWRELVNKEKKQEKYIFAYFLSDNSWYVDFVKEYAKQKKLPIHIIYNFPEYERVDGNLITAGPIEFLKEIDSATLVFTDSFHGTVFSTLLETEFVVFKRFGCPKNEGQNCRVNNIISKMEIPERFIEEDALSTIDNLPSLDFKSCKAKLQPFIDYSKLYLKNAIKGYDRSL